MGLIGGIPLIVVAGSLTGCTTISLTVDTAVDAVDANPGDGVCDIGDGSCSLRAAISEVDASSFDVATIEIASGVNPTLSIPPTSGDDISSGDLNITHTLVLDGNGATIDGGGVDRVINHTGGALHIDDATITHGRASAGGGGGVASYGNLTMKHVYVTDNQASTTGGGISITTSTTPVWPSTFEDVDVIDNLAINMSSFPGVPQEAGGGGVFLGFSTGSSALTWHGGRIEGNTVQAAFDYGAAVYGPSFRADHLTVAGNHAGLGILAVWDSTFTASTVSGNTSGWGIFRSSGTIRIERSTFADNDAQILRNQFGQGPLDMVIQSSTLVYNTFGDQPAQTFGFGPDDSYGSIYAQVSSDCSVPTTIGPGLNLSFRTGCVPSQLGPLTDNGGPTLTELPTADSLAVNAIPVGTPAACDATTPADQRGVARPRGGGVRHRRRRALTDLPALAPFGFRRPSARPTGFSTGSSYPTSKRYPAGMRDADALARIRRICGRFPEVEEAALQDRPLFRVRSRRFAIFNGQDSPPRPRWQAFGRSLHVVSEPHERAALEQDPRFRRSPHHGDRGWLALDLQGGPVDWDEIAELLEAGYRHVANRALVARLDAST